MPADPKISITIDVKTMKMLRELAQKNNKTIEELTSQIVKMNVRRAFLLRNFLESFKEEEFII